MAHDPGDQARKNAQRSCDYADLRALVFDARVTMTEREKLQEIMDGLSDIVEHYVLTDEERAYVKKLCAPAILGEVRDVDDTERVLEWLYRDQQRIRKGYQPSGFDGAYDPQTVGASPVAMWSAAICRALGRAPGKGLHEFRLAMLDLASVAIEAVVWVDKKIGDKKL